MQCSKCSSILAGGLLTLITLAHAVRAAMGWSMVINGMAVPVWASVVAAVITGLLAIGLFRSACCCCCGKKAGCCDDKAGGKHACCDKPADTKPA
jgi:hypothetical protein